MADSNFDSWELQDLINPSIIDDSNYLMTDSFDIHNTDNAAVRNYSVPSSTLLHHYNVNGHSLFFPDDDSRFQSFTAHDYPNVPLLSYGILSPRDDTFPNSFNLSNAPSLSQEDKYLSSVIIPTSPHHSPAPSTLTVPQPYSQQYLQPGTTYFEPLLEAPPAPPTPESAVHSPPPSSKVLGKRKASPSLELEKRTRARLDVVEGISFAYDGDNDVDDNGDDDEYVPPSSDCGSDDDDDYVPEAGPSSRPIARKPASKRPSSRRDAPKPAPKPLNSRRPFAVYYPGSSKAHEFISESIYSRYKRKSTNNGKPCPFCGYVSTPMDRHLLTVERLKLGEIALCEPMALTPIQYIVFLHFAIAELEIAYPGYIHEAEVKQFFMDYIEPVGEEEVDDLEFDQNRHKVLCKKAQGLANFFANKLFCECGKSFTRYSALKRHQDETCPLKSKGAVGRKSTRNGSQSQSASSRDTASSSKGKKGKNKSQ